jgi:hypothetical protein
MMCFSLEVQNGVDDVFEHLRPREAAVLGDVPDEKRRDVLAFCGKEQLRRGLAHLSDAAGGGLEAQ